MVNSAFIYIKHRKLSFMFSTDILSAHPSDDVFHAEGKDADETD